MLVNDTCMGSSAVASLLLREPIPLPASYSPILYFSLSRSQPDGHCKNVIGTMSTVRVRAPPQLCRL